jgi:glycosyltransferase involved in cell wall biosynthesis
MINNKDIPKCSIVIPVYNREQELKRAISSVIKQTYINWELLVIDDFSELDIKKTVDEFNDSRIIYKRLGKKGNANVCRNLGIRSSTGEFVAMLDSDDEWLPNHLEKSIEALLVNKVDGVFGSFLMNDGIKTVSYLNRPIKHNECMVNYILDGNSTATPTHFYRKHAALSVLWDENLHRHQDYDFIIRFSEKYKIAVVHLLTVIVHWERGITRQVHVYSNIMFLEKYKYRMKISYFIKYNIETLTYLMRHNLANSSECNYFRNNLLNNIAFLSLADFMSFQKRRKNFISKLYYRLKYSFLVMFSNSNIPPC